VGTAAGCQNLGDLGYGFGAGFDVAHGGAARRVLCEHPGATVDLSPALTSGDPVLVERLIANLVENAEKYNDQRRFIAVRTGTGNDGCP
jgi:K+-sensing histidine kinase KdpD